MKKIFHLTIALFLFITFSCNYNVIHNDHLIDYQGNTSLKIEIKNCNDTTRFNIFSVSIIPFNFSKLNLIATEDSIFEVLMKSTRPFLGKLYIHNSTFPVYTIPKDTLEICIDLGFKDSIAIEYKGKTKSINDYFLYKFRKLKYDDIALPATNYTSPSYSIYEGANNIDSLFNIEKSFLSEYNKITVLPNWFVELEKNELLYYNASFKTDAVLQRNSLCNENTKFKDSYFDFLKTFSLNNSLPNSSTYYFTFLESYYDIKNSDSINETANGLKRAFQYIDITSHQVIKNLSDVNREMFLTYQFTQYYEHCVKSEQILKMDSLLDVISYAFNDTILLNTIKDYSKKKLNKIEQLTSLKNGQYAPYFYLSDANGIYHELKDYDGKLIYLSFWATWCSSCLKSIPEKNALVEEYRDKPIAFINVSLDEKENRWRRYLKENNNYGINLICKGNWLNIIKSDYNIHGVPRYILIDEKGKIIDSDAISPSDNAELKLIFDKYISNIKSIQSAHNSK